MTVDEIIAKVHSKAQGRTRYEGQEPFWDEMMVDEIERRRLQVKEAAKAMKIIVTLSDVKDEWESDLAYSLEQINAYTKETLKCLLPSTSESQPKTSRKTANGRKFKRGSPAS